VPIIVRTVEGFQATGRGSDNIVNAYLVCGRARKNSLRQARDGPEEKRVEICKMSQNERT
jgi:hypothetical protein